MRDILIPIILASLFSLDQGLSRFSELTFAPVKAFTRLPLRLSACYTIFILEIKKMFSPCA